MRSRCFEILVDLSSYARWWTLVDVRFDAAVSRLCPGARFVFSGARPGADPFVWPVEVIEVEEPVRIELAYAGGEYVGRTAWELAEAAGESVVAYVYRGVRPVSERAREHFARWGTSFHSVAMQEDALAGLARLFGGPGAELDDRAWRRDVRRRVIEAMRGLESE